MGKGRREEKKSTLWRRMRRSGEEYGMRKGIKSFRG